MNVNKQKKLNQKGIGHHLTLMVVAVIAVVGASGFLIWQRQTKNEIDARAAGLSYIAPNSSRDQVTSREYMKMYACKNPSKKGKDYFMVSFGGQRLKTQPKWYMIRVNGKVWQQVTFTGSRNYAYPSTALQAYKTDSISMSWTGTFLGSNIEYNYGSIQVSRIANC